MARVESEMLACAEKCPFPRVRGEVRPCSEMVFNNSQGECAAKIASDPAFAGQNIKVETSVDSLMSHTVRIKEGQNTIAVVSGGHVSRENISFY